MALHFVVLRFFRHLGEFITACRTDGLRHAWCGWCRKHPTAADDVGFWFIDPLGFGPRPACKACLDGHLGRLHTKRYGATDR